jgi:hypothetical protein
MKRSRPPWKDGLHFISEPAESAGYFDPAGPPAGQDSG